MTLYFYGNETQVSINDGVLVFTWDDEDRFISVIPPGYSAPLDTFVYNGLGLRVGKTDSTGSYICDGTTPGAMVLTDGYALYTPGLSENKGGASRHYFNNRLKTGTTGTFRPRGKCRTRRGCGTRGTGAGRRR